MWQNVKIVSKTIYFSCIQREKLLSSQRKFLVYTFLCLNSSSSNKSHLQMDSSEKVIHQFHSQRHSNPFVRVLCQKILYKIEGGWIWKSNIRIYQIICTFLIALNQYDKYYIHQWVYNELYLPMVWHWLITPCLQLDVCTTFIINSLKC